MKTRLIFTGLLILVSFQTLSRQYHFTGFSLTDGLSQSVVNCLFQDSKGFLWIGTQNGLNRFDGFSFETFTFKPDEANSISNNWIYSIAEDKLGNLWIGTKGGLNKYDPLEKCFERIQYDSPYEPKITEYIYDVKCSRDGKILINTPPVLTICDPSTMTFEHYIAPLAYDGGIKDCNIPLLEDEKGTIWMGSTRGLVRFHRKSKQFELLHIDEDRQNRFDANNIMSLWFDSENNIWIGTASGLLIYDQTLQMLLTQALGSSEEHGNILMMIRAIAGDASGNIWLATEGQGLHCVQKNTSGWVLQQSFSAGNSGINHDIILSLLVDRSENLWCGTLSGVNKADLKRQKFILYRNDDTPYSAPVAGNVIASLFKDADGLLWVGTWGKGLTIYDREQANGIHYASDETGKYYIPNDFVHVIFEDAKKYVWIGTRDGLFIFDLKNHRFVKPNSIPDYQSFPDFQGLRINRIRQTKNGAFWIATQDGLFFIDPASNQKKRFSSDPSTGTFVSSNLVYDILEDSDGLLWIATSEGLDLYDPEDSTIKHYYKTDHGKNSLSDNFVTALCEDIHGNIWIGTTSYINVYNKRDNTFIHYSNDQGLNGNLAYNIIKDKQNCMWVATGNGLYKFDGTGKFRAYSTIDGLQSPEFNLGAACVCPDGEILLGGMNGFNAFYPDSLTDNPYPASIVITAIYTSQQGTKNYINFQNQERLQLRHNDNSFTVEFAGLEYTHPAKNRYKYQISDSGKDWVDIGNRNFIAFTHLAPGEYTLKVAASNNDGIWSETTANLAIVIKPPWWRSIPAYLAYAILTVSILIIVFRVRERKHRMNQKMLEKKVLERTLQIENQKEEIIQKNNALNELNAAKDRFFSIIAHDLRNPFNYISGITDMLVMDGQDEEPKKLFHYLQCIRASSLQAHELLENLLLWARSQTGSMAFNPEPANMKALIEEAVASIRGQASNKKIIIHLEGISSEIVSVDINMISTVLRNLLTNAIKYTFPGGDVWVSHHVENQWYVFCVKDNGTGIAPEKIATLFRVDKSHKTKGTSQEPGTGLGLILCKELVEKHLGKIEVTSTQGMGSEFLVFLPRTS